MKKSGLIGVILLSAALIAGCGKQSAKQENTPEAESTEAVSVTEEPSATEMAQETADAGTDTTGKSEDTTSQKEITMEEAKEIALKKAGLQESDGSWKKEKKDREDGRMVYELEFVSGKTEYEFEIDTEKGTILDYDVESVYDD